MFINGICEAADCFDLAGRDYKMAGFTESDIMEESVTGLMPSVLVGNGDHGRLDAVDSAF